MQDDVQKAILAAVRHLLRARGAASIDVELRGEALHFRGAGLPRTVALGDLGQAWNLLPPEDRARRLGAAVDRALEGAPVTRVTSERLVVAWVLAGVLCLAALASVAWANAESGRAAERKRLRETPPAPSAETAKESAARQQSVCTGVRKRVASGAPFGPYDAEGWVVELWLAREDATLVPGDPQLEPLVQAKAIPEAWAPELSALSGTAEVAVPDPPPGDPPTSAPGGVIVRLRGGYATSFVDPKQRPRFLSLADALFDKTHAQLGALWARCGDLPWHDLGGWFRGVDRGAAVGVLLFQSGRYGDGGAVHASAPGGSANTLGGLIGRSRRAVTDRTLELGVKDLGGRVDADPKQGTTITFPLAGYTLAKSASRELAALVDRSAP